MDDEVQDAAEPEPWSAEAAEALIAAGPGNGDPDAWAQALLRAAQRRNDELASRATTAMSEHPLNARNRAWAELVEARATRPVDSDAILTAVQQLLEINEPALAVLGLAHATARARSLGLRAAGELVHLARLAIVDAADNAAVLLPLRHRDVGREAHAKLVADAWPLVRSQDLAGLAAHLEAPAATPGVLDPAVADVDVVARGLALAVAGLRTHPPGGVDLSWLRGEIVRGLAFAVPALGEARFEQYDRYTRERGLSAAVRVPVLERWAQALTLNGQLGAARNLFDGAGRELGEHSPDLLLPKLILLRGTARMWRVAGDPQRGLVDSDHALDLMTAHDGVLGASVRGNVWLNRAALLEALNRFPEAYEAATRAYESYAEDDTLTMGRAEAQQLQCVTDPDALRGTDLARDILHRHHEGRLPQPVRSISLLRAAQRLTSSAPYEALAAFRAARATAAVGRRSAVLSALEATRFALDAADDVISDEAEDWGRWAVHTADEQSNRLLGAQARLLLARCLARGTDHLTEAAELGRQGLDDLAATLAGLTTDGGERTLQAVHDDLISLFDVAVRTDDGELAFRTTEVGRALRLAAMFRLDADTLPKSIREAIADMAAASRSEQGDGEQAPPGTGPTETRALRLRAGEALQQGRQALEDLCGTVVSAVTMDAAADPLEIRATFAGAHLLSLSERDGELRWVWWPPDDTRSPRCGHRTLSARARRLLADHASGAIRQDTPGDVTAGLAELLPPGLVEVLANTDDIVDLLVSPTGRLWHVPLLAVPVGGPSDGPARRVVHAARLTLTPSLRYAQLLAERHKQSYTERHAARTVFYCNPQLPGAQLEESALLYYLKGTPVPGVRDVGQHEQATIGVIATHADASPGLRQALIDHHGHRLLAGECMLRTFPPVVVLGACHGYGKSNIAAGDEPIGLLTVISARGTTWAIGGHQEINDASAAWILSRTYAALSRGVRLHDALRAAQLHYLNQASLVEAGQGAEADFPRLKDDVDLTAPWHWALTIVGPSPL